ncbi:MULTISPECIES: tryptophan halogenase family protein [Roseateles]|uniref:Flavin-dependent dehydrogenase n=1 Tax=Pelomonas aquatica TaxID=431058 RepID=A0ABU1Z7L7_9BURK|nr:MULTISPECIES: tryptophan halogenase family protein [Roseateles]KQY88387.1 tryptophan halogenase [Pelomonas sp. Root1444]MDR7295980.1 flavin-dependent dehydrogenase [Pelomonas aquatica]
MNAQLTTAVRRIVVLGGGSAGWLTAATLAAELGGDAPDALQVTLIESPDVPSIGVGEGTWPTMRATLRRIGLSEVDLVRECDAAFKQGSRFDGWLHGGQGDRYYHPFTLPHGYGDAELAGAWLQGGCDQAFAESTGPQPHLCNAHLAPKQTTTPDFGGVVNYGYHFDAVKLGHLLRRHATTVLGVRHVVDHFTAVRAHENGDIAALATREHGDIEGDLFIDCSGLASLLLGKHFGVPFRSEKGVLFNDSALAVQVPHADARAPLASATVATAHAEGWTWDIGLPTRRGIGLVYSSGHTDEAAAERALLGYLKRSGLDHADVSLRRLRFSPGYREQFWHRNCVAVGLAAGFIEPLEASALALVELSAAFIRDEIPAHRADMDLVAKRFNDAFAYRWSRIIDFLKLHYVLSRRDDADYWHDHRKAATQPESLRDLLQLWQHRVPSHNDFYRVEEVFPAASYQYVLYGMQFKPALRALRAQQLAKAEGCIKEVATMTRRLLGGLPRHRDLIQHIHAHGIAAA